MRNGLLLELETRSTFAANEPATTMLDFDPNGIRTKHDRQPRQALRRR
jgi:hypothetical protein